MFRKQSLGCFDQYKSIGSQVSYVSNLLRNKKKDMEVRIYEKNKKKGNVEYNLHRLLSHECLTAE